MATQANDLEIGPKATILKTKIQQNRLYDDDRAETREEEAKRTAVESGAIFMTTVSKEEKKLISLLSHGCRLVANVEVASVSAEVLAVSENETYIKTWKEELQKDSEKTEVIARKINLGWEEAKHMTAVDDLQAALQELQEDSAKLVKQKQQLVDGLQNQLDLSDRCFNNERIIQSQQRTQILARVTEHVLELIKAYREALRNLQGSTDSNHENLMNYFMKELDNAVSELNSHLQDLMKLRSDRRLDRVEELIKIHVRGVESSKVMKRTRKDVEEVLLELYRLRTRQKVEEEQLQFNLVVLRQQFKETTSLLSEGRRKINALRPIVIEYRRKWQEHEKVHERDQRSKVLKVMQKKDQLRSMKGRFSQISTQISSQMRGIAYIHYNQLQDHIVKIHELERSIELTVLSRDFVQSDLSLLRELHPALQPKDTPALAAAARILEPQGYSGDQREEDSLLEVAFLKDAVKAAEFLVDTVPGTLSEGESTELLILEHIFWELGVNTEYDVQTIIKSAKQKWYDRKKSFAEALSESSLESGEEIFTIHEVLSTLEEFSRDVAKRERKEHAEAMKSQMDGSAQLKTSLMGFEQRDKWNKLVQETTVGRDKSWKIIRDALRKYLLVLNGRQCQSQQVENLRRENVELRHLLLGTGYSR